MELQASAATLTLAEWEVLDEDEPGEFVDGRLEAEETADSPHEVIVAFLLAVLIPWARARGGVALASDSKYALSPRRGRRPDVSVFFTNARKLPRRGATRIPPDLVVEVLSQTPRDRRRDRVGRPLARPRGDARAARSRGRVSPSAR